MSNAPDTARDPTRALEQRQQATPTEMRGAMVQPESTPTQTGRIYPGREPIGRELKTIGAGRHRRLFPPTMLHRRHALVACARASSRALSTSAAAASPRAVARPARHAQSTARRVYAFAFGVGGVTLGLVGYKLLPRGEMGKADVTSKGEMLEPLLSERMISFDEVRKHNSRDSCWVVVAGEVYDVTGFLEDHPGGIAPILKVAGSDATRVFVPIHPPDTLSTLPPHAHVGTVDPSTVPKHITQLTQEEIRIQRARAALPPPDAAINLADIEKLAKTVLNQTAWAYYRSAGDDEFCEFLPFLFLII